MSKSKDATGSGSVRRVHAACIDTDRGTSRELIIRKVANTRGRH